jgi:hypothetical protein
MRGYCAESAQVRLRAITVQNARGSKLEERESDPYGHTEPHAQIRNQA